MFFNKKSNKSSKLFSRFAAVFMSVIILALLTGAVIDLQSKKVTLVMVDAFADSEKTQELTTRQSTVSEFLDENNIELGEFDKISMPVEDELQSGATLIINKGRNFSVNIDGNIQIISTTKKTIREAFLDAGITLSESDKVEPSLDTTITEDMNVTVLRVITSEVSVDNEIAFETKEVKDSSLAKGKTKIKTKGVNGIIRTTYSVTTENGVEIDRKLISEITVKEPTTQVVAVGTKQASKNKKSSTKTTNKTTSTTTKSADKSFSYSKKITVSASAYSPKAGAKTALGKPVQYGIVAVDPQVIPLGTKLYIESADGGKSWSYGYCVAGDTGGSIKGNKVDLFYNTEKECLQFGRRNAIVYILD